MFSITKSKLPLDAFLCSYAATEGCYTDCYSTDINHDIDLSEFVSTFYVTWLFKLERFILKYAVSKPSTDNEAHEVSNGQTDAFAAWTVEQRAENQLLMCDFADQTRSWFMVAPLLDSGQTATRLYFGSAVVPKKVSENKKPSIGFAFTIMLGFHKLYSRALLSAAKAKLVRTSK
ncbi:MAG: hypothetical protein DHS20C05_19230 [Hyphococcus sp.]|nr:MAG: hypothetical protein DHS20C05_19230 [Marinicaulis sp.]